MNYIDNDLISEAVRIERNTEVQPLRRQRVRLFAPKLAGAVACAILAAGFFMYGNFGGTPTRDPNTEGAGMTGAEASEASESAGSPASSTPAASESPSRDDTIVWNDGSDGDFTRLMLGDVVEASLEEWHDKFSLPVLEDEPFGMDVRYTFIYSRARSCTPCFVASGRRDSVFWATPGCDECEQGDEFRFGQIHISDGENAGLIAQVRPVCPDTDYDAEEGIRVCCYTIPAQDTFVSRIRGIDVVLFREVCEYFGLRTYGRFVAQGHSFNFSAVGFTEDMVVEFVVKFSG
jgi:hypothetical protein